MVAVGSPTQAAAGACANIYSYGKIVYHNDLSLCSAVGVHDLALEKEKNVKARFDPKSSLKNCELENVVR